MCIFLCVFHLFTISVEKFVHTHIQMRELIIAYEFIYFTLFCKRVARNNKCSQFERKIINQAKLSNLKINFQKIFQIQNFRTIYFINM